MHTVNIKNLAIMTIFLLYLQIDWIILCVYFLKGIESKCLLLKFRSKKFEEVISTWSFRTQAQ